MIGKIAHMFPTAFREVENGNKTFENKKFENKNFENERVENEIARDETLYNERAAIEAGKAALEESAEAAEEARYLDRARIGDQIAISWLITRYRQRAVRLAARILHRPEEAEDVAQEAFIRAFRHLHTYRGEGRFYTWLYHIVVRLCLDRQRVRWWKAEEPITHHDLPAPANGQSAETIEHHMLVTVLLDRLRPQMRAMLVLRELEGLEYAEIADVLAIPIGRVKWRLHAARAQFRVIWEEAMQEVKNV